MTDQAYKAGLDAFHETFQAEQDKAPEGASWKAGGRATKKFPNKEDKSWWLAEGPVMVHNYYNWRQQNPNLDIWHTPEGIPAIELGVVVNLPGDVTLKSYIDRVFVDKTTGKTIIVDLKTGKPPSSGLQLAFYRLALHQQFGEAPQYGAYWMGRQGTLDNVYDLNSYPTDMVARWIRDVKKAIDMRVFIPHVGQLCGYCGVQKFCYAHGSQDYIPNFLDDLENGNE